MAFRQSDTNGRILARYEDLLRATVDWEWETDAAGLLIGLSASVTSSLGRPPQSLLGRKLLGLAEAGSLQGEKSDRASVGTAELAACLSAHRTFRQLPVALLDAEDKAVSLLLNGVPYYAANGSFAGYRGTALRSSATILQSGESETNKRLLSLLEAALNRKDELENERRAIIGNVDWTKIGAMAHELRTPLNAILGFAEIIRDQRFGHDEKRYSEYAGLIHDSGRHLVDVVQTLLELADKERQMGAGETELIDPLKVASFVLIVLEEEANRIGVSLVNRLPTSLPQVEGERRALRQILLNLVTNGLKYTAPGGEVSLSAEVVAGKNLLLMVHDNGIGIPEDEQPKIFERHYRVPEARDIETGKGLGLAISRDLARNLGGDITVESTSGSGSCFTLILPLTDSGKPQQPSDESKTPSAKSSPGKRKKATTSRKPPRKQAGSKS
jgi:signal transduction histidine kinase